MYGLKSLFLSKQAAARRGGRVVEGTRLLIWRTGNGTEGSNPSLSAKKANKAKGFLSVVKPSE
jgi:hypothetical protein